MRLPALLSILLLFSGSLFSATIHVPADQPTIQAGINAAISGDTVLVASGTYQGDGNRDIDFSGKGIVLKSENGPEVTIIDCQGSFSDHHRGFTFHSGENSNSVVDGFTVKNGWGTGCGVLCENGSSPQIRNCAFLRNNREVITCSASSPHFENCTIANNNREYSQAIVAQMGSHPTFQESIVAFNPAEHPAVLAIQCYDSSSITMICSVVFGNTGADWGGDWVNCISDQVNINDNLFQNPMFCDRLSDQLHLRSGSPCISTNNSCGVTIGAFDVDESCVSCCQGVAGNIDGDPDDRTDIGDLTFLIDHLMINFPSIGCKLEGNIDGDLSGSIDIADLTYLIDHLFINFPQTAGCL